MKKSVFIITFLIVALSLSAQKNFEGRIVYNMYGNVDDDDLEIANIFLDLLIGENKILLKSYDSTKISNEYTIFDFLNNTSIAVDTLKKTYYVDSLIYSNNIVLATYDYKRIPIKDKVHLGYRCSASQTNLIFKNSNGKITSTETICRWYGDSLNFKLTKEQLAIPEMNLFSNGKKILTEAENIKKQKGKEGKFSITATLIEKGKIADSLFKIPKQYTNITDSLTKMGIINFKIKTEINDIKIEKIKSETPPPPPPPPLKPPSYKSKSIKKSLKTTISKPKQ